MAIKRRHLHGIDHETALALGIRAYPGYSGEFTKRQAFGAISNGTRVIKTASAPGDLHPDGTRGVVHGSTGSTLIGIYYFVEWETQPRFVSGIMDLQIREARDGG